MSEQKIPDNVEFKVTKPSPFLKWAGGKRWFCENHLQLIPPFNGRYFEPFLGSGAVFFTLQPATAVISDSNPDLIATYTAIRDSHLEVLDRLRTHQKKHSSDYYYSIRKQMPSKLADRAARFIYLNRTCWNGLYRVNKNGQFNVPIGTKDSVILSSDDFAQSAQILSRAKLVQSDFESIVDLAMAGDLLFADPPYTVRHNQNGFVKYNSKLFTWQDQMRLMRSLLRAQERGVMIIATNAAHDSIDELYRSRFSLTRLSRHSVISGDASFRGKYEEFLITANI